MTLLSALNSTIEKHKEVLENPSIPWSLLYTMEPPIEFLNLVEELKKNPSYSIFNEHLQMLGGGGTSNNYLGLAFWLFKRSGQVESTEAIQNLDDYLMMDTIPLMHIMLLGRVHIDADYTFQNGVKLHGIHNIPNRDVMSQLSVGLLGGSAPFPDIDAILSIEYRQVKFHTSNLETEMEPFPRVNLPIQELEDVRRCLALARPIDYGIHSVGHLTIAPDHLPFPHSNSDWSVTPFKSPPMSPPVLEIEMSHANSLLGSIYGRGIEFRNKLAIPADKLNGYSSGASSVDKAIDLRICLESTLLQNKRAQKIRSTLAKRAASFLGEEVKMPRKQIEKIIKDAYDRTSAAVHTGILPEKGYQNMELAAKLVKQVIIKMINEGIPNWEQYEENPTMWENLKRRLCT